MSNSQVLDEVGKIVACLLVSRKELCTIQDLERDFRETEGRELPWCQLGYISSFDLLRSLSKYVRITQQNGRYIVAPVVTEKTRHVNNMVALQRSSKQKKNSYARRRPVSLHIPQMRTEPRLFIPNDLQTQITRQLLQHPHGMSKHCVLQLFRPSYPYITMDNIDQYLHAMTSTATVCGNMVYPHRDLRRAYGSSLPNTARPVTNSNSAINNVGPTPLLEKPWTEINKDDRKPMNLSNISVCPAGSEEGGNLDGDIEFDDEDEFDYVSPVDYVTENKNYLPGSATVQRESIEQSSIPQFDEDNTSRPTKALFDPRTDENDNLQEEKYAASSEELSDEQETDLMNETYLSDDDTSHIINPRTKDRLQRLIQKHPDGIWCAELLNKFFDEYKVNLDFMELGFASVCELAFMLTDVFHCIRLDDLGDFILYDATKPVPQPSTTHRRTQLMTEWIHPLNDDTDDDMYAIPMNLPLYTSQRLIPDNVFSQGESVGQEIIPDEACVEVLVAEVYTPSLFWIQFRKKHNKLRNLMTAMQTFYQNEGDNYVIPSVVLEKGLNCVCMYDTEWHRAIIRTVKPDGNVELIFYDYGTIQTNPSEALRFLHRSFSHLPAQAIPTCAYNIRPITGERWTRSASVAFLRQISCIPLVAMIVRIERETNSMQVSLADTREEEDLHINDWMVAKKYARYGSMGDKIDLESRFIEDHELEVQDDAVATDNDAGTAAEDASAVTNDADAVTNDAGAVTNDAGAVTNDANPTENSTDVAKCNENISENNTDPRDSDSVSPLWVLGIIRCPQDQLKPPPGFPKLTGQRDFTVINEILQNVTVASRNMNNDNSQNIYQCNSNPFLRADTEFNSMPVPVQTLEQTWNQQLPIRDVPTTTEYHPYSADCTPNVSQMNLHNVQITRNDSEILQDTTTNPFKISYWNNGQSLENSTGRRKLRNPFSTNENINECPSSNLTFGDTLQYLQRDSTAFDINQETLSSSMAALETRVDESYKNLANLTLNENCDAGPSNAVMDFIKQFENNSKNPCIERFGIDANYDSEKNVNLDKDTDAILSADAKRYTNDVSLNGAEQDNNVNWKNIMNDEKKYLTDSANIISTNEIETEGNENKINRLSLPHRPRNSRLINKFHKIDVNRIKEIKNNKIYYKGDPVMYGTKTTATDKNNEGFVQTTESSVEKTKCNPNDTSSKYASPKDVILDGSKSKASIINGVKTMSAEKIVTMVDPESRNVSSLFAKRHNIHTNLSKCPTKNSDVFNWTSDPVSDHNSTRTPSKNFYPNGKNNHCSEILANNNEYSPRFSYQKKLPVSPRFISPDMTDASRAAIKLVERATDYSIFDDLTPEALENETLPDIISKTLGKQRLSDTIANSDQSQAHASCAVSVEGTIPDDQDQTEISCTNSSEVVSPVLDTFPEEAVEVEAITSNKSLGNVECNEQSSTKNSNGGMDTMKVNNNTSTDNVTNLHTASYISTNPSNDNSIHSEAKQQQCTDDRYFSMKPNDTSPTNMVYHYPTPPLGFQYVPPLYPNSVPMNYIPTFPHPCSDMPAYHPQVNQYHNLNQGIPLYTQMIPGFSPVRNNWPNQWIPMPCFIPASVPPPTPAVSDFVQQMQAANVCDRVLQNNVMSDPKVQVDSTPPYNVPESYACITVETQPRTAAPVDKKHLSPQGRKVSANTIKNDLTSTSSTESTPHMMRQPRIHSNAENHTSCTGSDNFINFKCPSECHTDEFIASTELQQSQGGTKFVSEDETASSVQQESISSAKFNRSTSPQLEPTERDSINPRDPIIGVQNHWFKQVETSHGPMFIISWDEEGWVCTDEIVSAFTSFQSREVIIRLVTLLHLKINFKTLNRWQSPDLFFQLDGTTLQLPRMANSNRIIGSLHLTPLKSLVRLLINVKVISDEEVHDLARQKKLPSNSTLMEILKLLEAYEDARKCWAS